MYQRYPQGYRAGQPGKGLQVAIARPQQRFEGAEVVGVREPDYAVFSPELRMKNGVRPAQEEQSGRDCDGDGPKDYPCVRRGGLGNGTLAGCRGKFHEVVPPW